MVTYVHGLQPSFPTRTLVLERHMTDSSSCSNAEPAFLHFLLMEDGSLRSNRSIVYVYKFAHEEPLLLATVSIN